jgi:magnesium-protoporphyrin O-methyltransferase
MSSCACEEIGSEFDRAKAEKELRKFDRRGPLANTRRLIDQLRTRVRASDSLLDIGGGVGAIHHLLLDAGVERAVHLDASSAFLDVARAEAARRGHAGRVEFLHADFVASADDIGSADVVTLDRVVCCYPDMETMVSIAAEKTRRLLGAVYPREVWWMRVAVSLENLMSRLRGSSFRMFLHSPEAIKARLAAKGLQRAWVYHSALWEVAIFERSSDRRSSTA